MRVLLQVGHEGIEQISAAGLCPGRDPVALSHSTGANGERAWNRAVANALSPLLLARGFEVMIVDAVYHAPLYTEDWDLILAIHAQRDAPTHRAFASAPNPAGGYIGPAAQAIAERWVALFGAHGATTVPVPVTPEFVSANMTDYYGWCYATVKSPCVIVETKNLEVDSLVNPDEVAATLRDVTVAVLGGSPAPPAPGPILLAAMGPTRVTRQRAIGALWGLNERASVAVIELYLGLAPLADIPAEAVISQMIHETGALTFPRIARPEWNNYAGLGCSEATKTCNMFGTPEEGVRGHLGHWLCYFGDHFPPFCDFDQRHDLIGHLRRPNDVAELSGRWAPSMTYADPIIRLALEMVG